MGVTFEYGGYDIMIQELSSDSFRLARIIKQHTGNEAAVDFTPSIEGNSAEDVFEQTKRHIDKISN